MEIWLGCKPFRENIAIDILASSEAFFHTYLEPKYDQKTKFQIPKSKFQNPRNYSKTLGVEYTFAEFWECCSVYTLDLVRWTTTIRINTKFKRMTIRTFKSWTFYKFSSWHWVYQIAPIINSPIKFVKFTFTDWFLVEWSLESIKHSTIDIFMSVEGNSVFQEWFFETKCVSRWEIQAPNSIFEELPRI